MRIRQNQAFLTELLKDTRAGRIVPATFQRPYVWSKADVTAFWTSLLRGWPIGSFLLWIPPADLSLDRLGRGRIGPIMVDPSTRPMILLDGQNRLSSFAWSCLLPGDPVPADLFPKEAETWAAGERLVVDGTEQTVRFVPENETRHPGRYPAGHLAHTGSLWPLVRKDGTGVSDAAIDWLFDHAERSVGEARCTVTVLEDAPAEEALDAFRHIARTGVPMSDEDFAAALSWALPTAR